MLTNKERNFLKRDISSFHKENFKWGLQKWLRKGRIHYIVSGKIWKNAFIDEEYPASERVLADFIYHQADPQGGFWDWLRKFEANKNAKGWCKETTLFKECKAVEDVRKL